MTKYKIRETALIMGKDGTPVGKKMVLKSDEQQNEEPRVTLWNSDWEGNAEFEKADAGSYISGFLHKKDSGTPIPGRSGNYVNRTLYQTERNPNGTEKPDSTLEKRVEILESIVLTKPEGKNTTGSTEDIVPDDIPF